MTYAGVFVDDNESELATLLSVREQLNITYREVAEAPGLANEIFNGGLDIVILDFRLDENPEMVDPAHAYLGSGLAQLLRDKAIADPSKDVPVVLMSAEAKFERFYRPDSTAHDLFDRTYAKEDALSRRRLVSSQLIDLCVAYRTLKKIWSEDRMTIFNLREEEREVIDNQELRKLISTAGAPHIAANYVLRSIIDRPGLLFSDADAAARFGVSSIEPLVEVMLEAGLQYEGIFGSGWRRWWAHRVNSFAEKIFGRRPATMGGDERAEILIATFGSPVLAAKSTWNRSSSERFAVACASCQLPSEIRHSVSAFDPNSPKFALRRRICWDCIQTDRNIGNNLDVDDVDQKLAEDVKKKSREAE